MRPLGTITKYFTFFNSETCKTLESIMNDALHYADFAKRLCKYVHSIDAPENLVFFSICHASNTQNFGIARKMMENYRRMPLVDFYFIDMHKELEAINSILETNPEDWIKFNLHSFRFLHALTHSLGSALQNRSLEEMKRLVQNNSELKCFEDRLLFNEAYLFYHEEKQNEALECLQKALVIAKKYNDRWSVADILWHITMNIRNFPKKGLLIVDEIEKIIEELGYLPRHSGLWNLRAALHRTRGEFDATIDNYLKCLQCMQSASSRTTGRFIPNNLAFTYNLIGDGEEALEWARMSIAAKPFASMNPSIRANSYLNMARALINLGRLEEAEYNLDIGRELALDIGLDRIVSLMHVATGLLERAQGDVQTAMQTFQKALEISEGKNRHFPIEGILYCLAESEIMLFTHFDDQTQDDVGPWLTRLETESREKDFPGYLGLALLLKAQLRMNQGRVTDAYEILEEAIDISRNPETKFLEKKIAKLILTAFPEQS